ncbi:adenosylcobinamide-phosphate synthase CbiB [Colwellia sp. RSH04]|uniref:adenosylcobinamide-phosphate synthase CbiB n=1 Tax=Colwellia sp. RSH04 TaxID=2305464 RepID=UPI000E577F7E|nr:adenosylcobinamide-phosphate synthase CbiB [Colwellia sp. RSH04]RHW75867.1 cobalamin biosynthesis protein CobD [Colwellia sp. RSH04]
MLDEQWLLQVSRLLSPFSLTSILVLALMLDYFLGEPKKYHYLVGFGNIANFLEKHLNHYQKLHNEFSLHNAFLGAIAWCLLILPLCYFSYYLLSKLPLAIQFAVETVTLYLALGLKSLNQHAMQVFKPLQQGDLSAARHYTGYLVSRDTQDLTAKDMSRATVESMLENGHDAVIASLIFYIIGGIPLVILHRLSNTLDAMWGYKTARFNSFGYFSARADDVLGFLTGKICTLLYALQQPFIAAMKNAYLQGNQYKSHNGGWVMAAGATVMNRVLGGKVSYHGQSAQLTQLGQGKKVNIDDIPRSISVVQVATITLVVLVFSYQLISYIFV